MDRQFAKLQKEWAEGPMPESGTKRQDELAYSKDPEPTEKMLKAFHDLLVLLDTSDNPNRIDNELLQWLPFFRSIQLSALQMVRANRRFPDVSQEITPEAVLEEVIHVSTSVTEIMGGTLPMSLIEKSEEWFPYVLMRGEPHLIKIKELKDYWNEQKVTPEEMAKMLHDVPTILRNPLSAKYRHMMLVDIHGPEDSKSILLRCPAILKASDFPTSVHERLSGKFGESKAKQMGKENPRVYRDKPALEKVLNTKQTETKSPKLKNGPPLPNIPTQITLLHDAYKLECIKQGYRNPSNDEIVMSMLAAAERVYRFHTHPKGCLSRVLQFSREIELEEVLGKTVSGDRRERDRAMSTLVERITRIILKVNVL